MQRSHLAIVLFSVNLQNVVNLVKRLKMTLTRCVASGQLPGHHKRLVSFQPEQEITIFFICSMWQHVILIFHLCLTY